MDWCCLVVFLVLLLAFRHWVAEPFRVKGSSMASTLHSGDMLWTTKYDYRRSVPARHNVVICYYPGRYVFGKKKGLRQCFVKRVIGLPGETVEIRDGVVYINDLPLDEPYLDAARNRRPHQMRPVTLGPEEVFVLGDNRDNSNDSRRVGPLPLSMIRARVRRILWPWRHRGTVAACQSAGQR